MTRALILADGFRLQYRALRCAAECFDEVYVLGTVEATKLRHSRYTKEFILCDGPLDSLFADRRSGVRELLEERKIDFILPSSAETTRVLAIFGHDLAIPYYPVPDLKTFDTLDCKWRFFGLCEELRLPTPETRFFTHRDLLIVAAHEKTVTFPFVVKPLAMWGGYGVHKIDAINQIPRAVNYAPLLCQEYVKGADECAFYLCRQGRILSSFSYTRIEDGLRTIEMPDVEARAEILVEHLKYTGLIGFDVRRRADGSFVFIDCNPRFWYRMDVALVAGMNFVEMGYIGWDNVRRQLPQIEMRSPARIVANAIWPWSLNKTERAYLTYLSRDIPATIRLAVESKITTHGATGRLL